jgi:hypothetical protein
VSAGFPVRLFSENSFGKDLTLRNVSAFGSGRLVSSGSSAPFWLRCYAQPRSRMAQPAFHIFVI